MQSRVENEHKRSNRGEKTSRHNVWYFVWQFHQSMLTTMFGKLKKKLSAQHLQLTTFYKLTCSTKWKTASEVNAFRKSVLKYTQLTGVTGSLLPRPNAIPPLAGREIQFL